MVTATKKRPEFSFLEQLDPIADARVDVLLNRYRQKWNLNTGPAIQDGSLWFGLNIANKLAIAVNVRQLNPQVLEVMNLCPVKGRNGVLAVYEALNRIKSLVDDGIYTGVICHTFYKNKPFIRALARVFKQSYNTAELEPVPYALVYTYGVV